MKKKITPTKIQFDPELLYGPPYKSNALIPGEATKRFDGLVFYSHLGQYSKTDALVSNLQLRTYLFTDGYLYLIEGLPKDSMFS